MTSRDPTTSRPISLDAPTASWAREPLPDVASHEEEVRLPGSAAERIYIPPSPPWTIGRALFLRGMGAVYLVAFVSLAVQVSGLFGPRGLMPFPMIAEFLAANHVSQLEFPSLFRVIPGLAERPEMMAWIGALFGAALMVGLVPPVAAIGAWALYLSFVSIGVPFLTFQWDALLLESGLLAILVAPWRPTLGGGRRRPLLAPLRWCLWFLVARLMLLSALVKLGSGSIPWRNGTALGFHWWTQPIPNPIAWWIAQFPMWVDQVLTYGTLALELAVPVLILCGRWGRFVAALVVIALQVGIAITGNYGFFNLLVIVLALSLVDDGMLRKLLRRPLSVPIPVTPSRGGLAVRWCAASLAIAIALFVAVPASARWLATVRRMEDPLLAINPEWLRGALADVHDAGASWYLASGYGLFASMTEERPELTIEATRDGVHWEPYLFRYKAGPVDRRPPFALFHMPRLDWQMWFGALRWPIVEAWERSLERALLEARPEVLALFEHAPFGSDRPRAIRWRRDRYEFSSLGTDAARDHAWWVVVERGRPVQGLR